MKKLILIVLVLLTGMVVLNAQKLGDVNLDSNVDIVDALLIAQAYVGLTPEVFFDQYGDVDANGLSDIVDSLLIAQLYVGLIDVLPGGNTGTGEEPKAAFTISNLTPFIGETVIFDATTSTDPDGQIVSYEWDFKDGTTASGMVVSHVFSEIDDYNVKLIVTDNQGISDKKDNRVFVGRPYGWTEDTHHKSADPDYEVVFPQDSVIRIDINISPANYRIMEDDIAGFQLFNSPTPVYVPVDVHFNGQTWWNVGMRYKGQSTLFNGVISRVHKYPFRFNFDKYEDDHPEIKNQHFYGFSEMTFCNNWGDDSFLREKICSDIFRNGGIPSAMGTFCRVFVDTGNGPVYWGLYTMVEDISDVFAEVHFDDGDGNMYKPEKDGADWTAPFRQDAFVKKSNEDAADWSDVQSAHSALHASRSNSQNWRNNLDASFNVEQFLGWLAINTGIVNWDSYGTMAQNYYLYQNLEDNGRLTWIPWDHNLSMMNSMMGRTLDLSLDGVRNNWPLIRYLMDDSVYNDLYHQKLSEAANSCLVASQITERIDYYYNLIRPYIVGPEGEISGYTFLRGGESTFNNARQELIRFVNTRESTVRNYLQRTGY